MQPSQETVTMQTKMNVQINAENYSWVYIYQHLSFHRRKNQSPERWGAICRASQGWSDLILTNISLTPALNWALGQVQHYYKQLGWIIRKASSFHHTNHTNAMSHTNGNPQGNIFLKI